MNKKVLTLLSLLTVVGVGAVALVKAPKTLTKADTTLTTATIAFGNGYNAFPTNSGNNTYTTGTGYTDAIVEINMAEGITATTVDGNLVITNNSDDTGYYSMKFKFTGVKSLSFTSIEETNPTFVAYYEGTSTFTGYIGSGTMTSTSYNFCTDAAPEKFDRLSFVARATAHSSVTVTNLTINYFVEYCNGTL